MSPLRALGTAGVLALLFGSAGADAKPSVWERAREPRLFRAERALERLERIFDGVAQANGDPDMMQDFRLGTLAIAEMTGARALGEPRLSLLLARALVGAEIGRDAEAVELLSVALAELPPGSAWLEAKLRLSLTEALRHEPALALVAATRALALAWEPSERSALLRARASAYMGVGRVRSSVSDARRALLAAGSEEEQLAARLVLGLALDRMGDLPSALAALVPILKSAAQSQSAEPGALDLLTPFSFRPEDGAYVAGLLAMAEASAAVEPDAQRAAQQRAIEAFNEYDSVAAPEDRWLSSARAHRAECELALRRGR